MSSLQQIYNDFLLIKRTDYDWLNWHLLVKRPQKDISINSVPLNKDWSIARTILCTVFYVLLFIRQKHFMFRNNWFDLSEVIACFYVLTHLLHSCIHTIYDFQMLVYRINLRIESLWNHRGRQQAGLGREDNSNKNTNTSATVICMSENTRFPNGISHEAKGISYTVLINRTCWAWTKQSRLG